MKKNLAKKIVLGLLTGAVLMSSSVAWAGHVFDYEGSFAGGGSNTHSDSNSIAVGFNCGAQGANSIAIGANSTGENSFTSASGDGSVAIGNDIVAGGAGSIAIGDGVRITGTGSVAIGANTKVTMFDSVALGYGSVADADNVVSVGRAASNNDDGVFRKIVNVADGNIALGSHDVVTGGQLYEVRQDINDKIGNSDLAGTGVINTGTSTLTGAVAEVSVAAKANQIKIGSTDFRFGTTYITNSEDLTVAAKKLDVQVKANADAIANVYTKEQADATFVKIQTNANDAPTSGFNVMNTDNITKVSVTHVDSVNSVVISSEEGITVGENSAHMDATGFYAGRKNTSLGHTYDNVKAAMTEDGKIKGADGKFEVDASGNVTAEKVTAKEVTAENLYTKTEIDGMLGGSSNAIAGINQRLDKTNAKINKVGAGAAALAALHPLEYDPDDKLTFSAGMGNYAGENAAALGAFYRPNEKFMVSLGGTMGNGENMVNLGLSIGLDKPNGYAKLSKRELIQKVNAMEAKYEAVEAENEAMKAEMAEMKAMLQAILAKK